MRYLALGPQSKSATCSDLGDSDSAEGEVLGGKKGAVKATSWDLVVNEWMQIPSTHSKIGTELWFTTVV